MVEVIPDINLQLDSFIPSLNKNGNNIFYQRVTSRNASETNIQFTVSSPNKRNYLLATAWVNYRFRLEKRTSSVAGVIGAAEGYGLSNPKCSWKPVLPVANGMSSITCQINGNSLTYSQPRHFTEGLSMLNVSRAEARKYYEGCAYPSSLGGRYDRAAPASEVSAAEVDHDMLENFYNWNNQLLRNKNDPAARFFEDVDNNLVIEITEPLICSPFNPYGMLPRKLGGDGYNQYNWFNNMSKNIPNIDRLEISIQFNKLVQSMFFTQYLKRIANGGQVSSLQFSANNPVSADLLLYWVETPVSTEIPRNIDLNTFTVREFQNNITATNDVLTTTNTQSDLIQLNSIPDLFMIHIERDKDDPLYQQLAMSTDDDGVGGNVVLANAGRNTWDSYAQIETLRVNLGDRPDVISGTFSSRELYNLTLKNSKEFPYTYNQWRGQYKPTFTGGADNPLNDDWLTYGSKCLIALTPQDLASKTSSGVFSSSSIQFIPEVRGFDGFAGYTGATQTWKMYVHLFFGKSFIRLESDRAQYQEMSLDANVARRLTDPPLGSMGVGMSGGSLSVGGALGGLRKRGLPSSAVSSRIG